MEKLCSENINNNASQSTYDCLVVGTGTSSEPVISHLSKTSLKTLIIDRSDISKEYMKVEKKKFFDFFITPKQIFANLKIQNSKEYFPLTSNVKLKCFNFSYIYSYVSGGLSNFWGGGLFTWPESEIIKATSLSTKLVKNSYKNISKRLKILSRDQFLKKSSFSILFLKKQKALSSVIFRPSRFFISKKGLFNHKNKKQIYSQNLIWKSYHSIREILKSSKNLTFFSKTTALSIKKNGIFYEVNCLKGNKYIKITTKSVFLSAGVINSTYLAFSALEMDEAVFSLNHSLAGIAPILYFGNVRKFDDENIELPDLSWTLLSKGIDVSGYLLSSFFIHRNLISKLRFRFFRNIYYLIEKILSSIAFLTIFSNSNHTKTDLKIRRLSSKNFETDNFLLEIKNNDDLTFSKKYIADSLKKLRKFIRGKFYILNFLLKITKMGGDIHYGSTMPEGIIKDSPISTSFIGELEEAKNIYICDASRLGFISSLPHTYTVMAIIDASMPFIIKKLQSENLFKN